MEVGLKVKIGIGIFFALLLGLSVGLVYFYFFGIFKISSSAIIRNKVSLEQYLGIKGQFPKPLEMVPQYGSTMVTRLTFVPQTTFKQTDDCVSPQLRSKNLFCFDETIKNGQMIIIIYPNPEVIQSEMVDADRLLNLGLLWILETRFGKSPEAKNTFLDNGEDNFIFKW